MTDSNGVNGVAQFYALAKNVYDKSVLVTAQSLADVQTAMDTQAALEQAWLEAWYLQQYWTEIYTELDTSKAGSKAKTFSDQQAILAGSDVGVSKTDAQSAANSAATALETAETALATLVATTSAAQAIATDLKTRINRVDAELAELGTLVKQDGTGTLNVAAAKRLADLNAYTDANTGEFTLATAEESSTAA